MLELMVVVAIVLVLLAFVVPSFQGPLNRYQLESSARNVVSILTRARYEAIRQNSRVSTIYVAGNPTVYGADLNNNGTLDVTEPRYALSATVAISSGSSAPSLSTMGANYMSATVPPAFQITFSPQGSVVNLVINGAVTAWEDSNSVYVIYLRNQSTGQWAAVTITPAGRFRAWIYSGSSWAS
jgi:Tfp pilus assembly protein FimT